MCKHLCKNLFSQYVYGMLLFSVKAVARKLSMIGSDSIIMMVGNLSV